MLEILAIAWLCSLNSKNAVSRGRKPGLFIFLTILFWILGEFLGGIIGGILGLEMGTYIVAIVLGILGGVCSYFLAKNCKPGDYVPKTKEKTAPAVSGDAPRFCENCGAKLTAGSLFCQNCGTKVPNAMPEVTPQTPHVLPQKAADAFSKAPYLLGYTAMILWCGIFGLHFIPGLPLMYQSNSSMFLSYTVLAVAGYLFWKRGLSHNASSYIFTAFFAVADVINPVLNLMSQKNMNRFKFSDFRLFGQYGIRILRMLVLVIVAVGLIFLLRAAFKNREKKSYALFALLFSGTVFLVRFLLDIKNMISVFVSGYPMVILVNLLSHFSVLAVLLVVLFTLSFMEKVPNKGGKNGVLGIIWAVLCIMANDTTAVLGIVNDYLTTSYAFFMGIAMMAAFIFLLAKRKYAFSLIAVLPILNGIIQLLAGISMRFSGSYSLMGILLTFFGAAANIFLTWLLVIREKKAVPQTVVAAAVPGKSSFEKNNIGARQETAAQKAVVNVKDIIRIVHGEQTDKNGNPLEDRDGEPCWPNTGLKKEALLSESAEEEHDRKVQRVKEQLKNMPQQELVKLLCEPATESLCGETFESKYSVRAILRESVYYLTEQQALYDVALNTADKMTRIEDIKSPETWSIQQTAVWLLQDQKLMEHLVLKTDQKAMRYMLLEKIESQRFLTDYIKTCQPDAFNFYRYQGRVDVNNLLNRITDQALLKEIIDDDGRYINEADVRLQELESETLCPDGRHSWEEIDSDTRMYDNEIIIHEYTYRCTRCGAHYWYERWDSGHTAKSDIYYVSRLREKTTAENQK